MCAFNPNQPNMNPNARPVQNNQIMQVEQSYKNAGKAVNEAIYALGKAYFEKNKEDESADFSGQIALVKENMEKEKLWHQYRLSFDGKMLCDSCGAVITSDSVFCNKCGGSIKPKDFSLIGVMQSPQNFAEPSKSCPSCGSPLVDGAAFCEKCGRKL